MIANFAIALAAMYHVLATVAAMMAVFHFARMLRGEESRHPLWRTVFSQAEAHLWVSGVALVLLGIHVTGLEKYLGNPKLWTKVSLITLWGLNSLWIKRSLSAASPVRRDLMFGISVAALFYGTFLGVAKPLAYGALPFPWFLAGFVATIGACTWSAGRLLRAEPSPAISPAWCPAPSSARSLPSGPPSPESGDRCGGSRV